MAMNNTSKPTLSYARPLAAHHLRACRVLPDRSQILSLLPTGGIVAEIGTLKGLFARRILSTVRPATLHIVDIDMSRLEREALEAVRGETAVHLHEGDSVEALNTFADESLDWIYIDADHSYEGARRDALTALRKIKRDGLLLFNDYTPYSPTEQCPYGVMHVVHELCLDHGFEMIYLALHGLGYHDVVLRRTAAAI
jgi:hypothetical protein